MSNQAIGLADQSYLEILINGKVLPLKEMIFGGILVSSHMLYHMPMGQLKFTDLHGVMSLITPSDGVLIIIKMGRTSEDVKQYTFRVFHVKSKPVPNGIEYSIPFIDTRDEWRLQHAVKAYNSSSRDALSAIAVLSKLQFNGDTTNDPQVWLPMQETYCKFARRISAHGYVDSASCMLLGVTLTGELRYKNLATLKFDKSAPVFCHGKQAGIWVTSWGMNNMSGLNNQTGGYDTTITQFQPSTTSTESQGKVKVTRISNSLNVNPEVLSIANQGAGRARILPIDSGNNHKNSVKAVNQNQRLKKLLSQSVSVLTPFDAQVELFDPVTFNNFVKDPNGGVTPILDLATSGYFISAGKTIYIGPNLLYCERYQLLRQGFNDDNGNKTL